MSNAAVRVGERKWILTHLPSVFFCRMGATCCVQWTNPTITYCLCGTGPKRPRWWTARWGEPLLSSAPDRCGTCWILWLSLSPVLPFAGCVTLYKWLTLSESQLLHCKMGLVVTFSLQGLREKVRGQCGWTRPKRRVSMSPACWYTTIIPALGK
jgi:hypothetical protein